MPAALLGAHSCGRCGGEQESGGTCADCAARWLPAADAAIDLRTTLALTGVVEAGPGRRRAARLLDLLPPLALLVWFLTTLDHRAIVPWPVPLLTAVAVALGEVALLTLVGRTPARRLLGLRTVDELTGTPVRPVRLARRLVRSGRADLLCADLRRGRDPVAVGPVAAPGRPVTGSAPLARAMPTDRTASGPSTPTTSSRPSVNGVLSVDVVLEGGVRHEVSNALLVGRSPADPTDAGRPLLAWPDLSRRLAKTHLLLEWSGQQLGVTDLGSATGTAVVGPGGARQLLLPGIRTDVAVGSLILCGGRSIKVVPHG
ncbi:RDD family protein [uncultured Friedmanniella sp.]|uniref:RDD family protein n=1 Tax=uncultured Friedmanniella sp. TaxID=335381 RepID=UPI0035CC4DCC